MPSPFARTCCRNITATSVCTDPFPYAIVDGIFPPRVYKHMVAALPPAVLTAALPDVLLDVFSCHIDTCLRSLGLNDPLPPRLKTMDRRLLCGLSYRIPPHRDPRWGFLTMLVYLGRDDTPVYGTQLDRVTRETEPETDRSGAADVASSSPSCPHIVTRRSQPDQSGLTQITGYG